MSPRHWPMGTIEVLAERKLADLLRGTGLREPLEASGVTHRGDSFAVVFDNLRVVAHLRADLSTEHNRVVDIPADVAGFEDITSDPATGKVYLLVEAVPDAAGDLRPVVVELDKHLAVAAIQPLDVIVERANKGLEGLDFVHRFDGDYLLGLCEGNRCRGGDTGRTPGKGRIHVFRREGPAWVAAATIKLPKQLRFEDYAALDVRNVQIAVVSQASAKLWIGRLAVDSWNLLDGGTLYDFPRTVHRERRYCNVEGVAWLDDERLVMVSDRTKHNAQDRRCATKDQMIHIVRIANAHGERPT